MTHKLLLLTSLLLISGMATAQDTSNKVSTNVEIPTAPNASATPRPKQISGGVLNGKAISLPKPVYPSEARVNNISGIVTVQVIIDESGNVLSAEPKSGPVVLQSVAVEAAKLAKFTPTTLEGQPVKVSGVITYNFVSPKKSLDRDEQMTAFLGSFFISFLANTEPDILEKMGDTDELARIFADMLIDLPEEFLPAKPLIEKLSVAKGAERSTAANELLLVFKNELGREQDTWFVNAGEDLGKIFTQLIKVRIEENNSSDNIQALKIHLGNLKTKSMAMPEGADGQIASTVNSILDLEKQHQIGSQEWCEKLFEIMDPLFDEFGEDVD